MSDDPSARVKEARQTLRLDTAGSSGAKRYRAKVFKSGNSLALRLPAELGLKAGMEMDLQVEEGGRYMLTRADVPKPRIDVSGFAGKAPGVRLAPREDFEERPSTIAARKAAGLA